MGKDKRTYQEVLKENISNMADLNEFDTTKTVDVKGPMLDPILGYDGDGELPTYKDAASVLERYYFGERRKDHEISEMDYENDKGDSGGESMKNTEGPEGEEQAGTSNANTPPASAKEKEKDIAKESEESDGEGEAVSEKEMNTADLKSKNMKDADGPEGEEQAGTGDTYKEFKKRVVESIEDIVESIDEETLVESDDEEEEEEKGEEKEEKDEEKEEMEEQASGAGHVPPGGLRNKMKNEDQGEEYEDEADAKGVKESEEIELDVEEDLTEALENEIIEKLLAELEEEPEEGEGISEQDEGEEDGEGDEGEEEEEELDVDKKMEEMVNRLTSEADTMKHTEGPEGEEQAGTGGDEKLIPPRKDRSNEGTKEKGTKPMDDGELADA